MKRHIKFQGIWQGVLKKNLKGVFMKRDVFIKLVRWHIPIDCIS
jgi:hypothetical protein